MTEREPTADLSLDAAHEELLHAHLVEQRAIQAALHRALVVDDAVNRRPPTIAPEPAVALAELDQAIARLARSIEHRRKQASAAVPRQEPPAPTGSRKD